MSTAEAIFLAGLLACILALLAAKVQGGVQRLFRRWPKLVAILPVALTAVFAAAERLAGTLSVPLTLLVLLYTALPVVLVALRQRALAILVLWLPIEFAAGASLVPIAARGFLHSAAYGIAILLGLLLFLGYAGFAGMKYNLPRSPRDLWLPLAAFAVTAPLLIVVGIAIGFIPPPHWPVQSGGRMALAAGLIFAGTALPEEILFRALIQNLMMQRFGENTRTLLAASLIFGAAHLDNGPQPLPNWRYMILATIAGVAYGKVFQKASSVTSSAILHAMVDWTKHIFF